MAACLLANPSSQAQVILLESPDIGIMGVGGGLTPQLRALLPAHQPRG